MKKSILWLSLLIVLFLPAFAADKHQAVESSSTAIVGNAIPNIFRPIGNFFKRLFGKEKTPVACAMANVNNLTLSELEITETCATRDNSCAKSQLIEVFTEASDPEDDVLIYGYTISAGRIIGEGEKVIWDLSGVKAGTYTITAAVDDGCGFCGQTRTVKVKVIKCPDCE